MRLARLTGSRSCANIFVDEIMEATVTYTNKHLSEAKQIIDEIDVSSVEKIAQLLVELRSREGRLFFLGVGGSAANCSHAVNDFDLAVARSMSYSHEFEAIIAFWIAR